jgi:hypothetical protein
MPEPPQPLDDSLPTAEPEESRDDPENPSSTEQELTVEEAEHQQQSESPTAAVEEEESESPPSPTPAPSLRPLVFSTDDERFSLRISLAAQLQLDSSWTGVDDGGEGETLFRIRRLQPAISGSLFTADLTYKLMIEIVPGMVDIMDLFLDYRFNPHLRLRFGVGKVGFTRMRLNSWRNQQFVDFSGPLRYWGTERQLGLTLHNGMGRQAGHEYEVGVYAGVPTRPGYAFGLARVSNEPIPHLMLVSRDFARLTELHPEVIFHYAYNGDGIDVTTETDWEREGFRYSVGVGGSYDFRPEAYRDFALRLAGEVMFKAYGWNFIGVFWTGFYNKAGDLGDASIASDFNLGLYGAELQTGYLYARWGEVALRYSFVRTSDNLRRDVRARSIALIDGAADAEERDSLEQRYGSAGTLLARHELALGLNFYPLGRNLKLATDLSYLLGEVEERPASHDLRLRFLVQVSF